MKLDLQRVQLENSPLPQATPDGFSLSFRCTLALDDSSATTTALVVKLPARMGPWFTRALTLPAAVMPGGLNPEEIQPFFEEASNVLRILPPSTTTATTTDANDDPLHDSVGRIHIHRLVVLRIGVANADVDIPADASIANDMDTLRDRMLSLLAE